MFVFVLFFFLLFLHWINNVGRKIARIVRLWNHIQHIKRGVGCWHKPFGIYEKCTTVEPETFCKTCIIFTLLLQIHFTYSGCVSAQTDISVIFNAPHIKCKSILPWISVCSSKAIVAILYSSEHCFSFPLANPNTKHSYCDMPCKSWIWFGLFHFVVFVLTWKSRLVFFDSNFSFSLLSLSLSPWKFQFPIICCDNFDMVVFIWCQHTTIELHQIQS